MALKLADVVVTEAGFGSDLGAEKFLDIKCRVAGLAPSSVVIVATAKAVAHHDAGAVTAPGELPGGLANLTAHIENIRGFNLEPVVALNRFPDDTDADLARIIEHCASLGVQAVVSDHFALGGQGALELARAVQRNIADNQSRELRFAYPREMPLAEKITVLARRCYGAAGVHFDRRAQTDLDLLTATGYGDALICIAKTPKSLSDDPRLLGRPSGFQITVTEVRVSAGAGFVVVICGDILTMPGLPKVPAAARIRVAADGTATGLS
jgi:formate--tetrahydrofolate ligase